MRASRSSRLCRKARTKQKQMWTLPSALAGVRRHIPSSHEVTSDMVSATFWLPWFYIQHVATLRGLVSWTYVVFKTQRSDPGLLLTLPLYWPAWLGPSPAPRLSPPFPASLAGSSHSKCSINNFTGNGLDLLFAGWILGWGPSPFRTFIAS